MSQGRFTLSIRGENVSPGNETPCEIYSVFQKYHPTTGVLCVQIYAKVRSFVQLSLTLTKLCHIKRFLSPYPDANLHCQTKDMGLVHRAVCLFTPQLLLVVIAPTHRGMTLYCIIFPNLLSIAHFDHVHGKCSRGVRASD